MSVYASPAPDTKTVARLYHTTLLIRRVEEHICEVYHTDAIKSPVHLSIGQESVAAGICDPLAPDDMVSNTYRCHATYIAKGGDLKQMMAELYGKSGGCAGGKAGSMHLIDMPHGIMGASAVVGTTIPVAMGFAQAMQWDAKKTGKQRVMVAVCGDGATEEGGYSETLNYAALKKLPILFVVENNGFAIHTPISRRQPNWNMRARVETYGIPTQFVGDGDVFAIGEATSKALSAIRAGSGPQFLECTTYRWMEHVGPTDDHDHGPYRDLKEYARWKENDQIARLEKMLGEKEAGRVKAEVEAELKASVAFAEQSPYPSANHLLKTSMPHNLAVSLSPREKSGTQRLIRYVDAIAEACAQEMERDERVFVFGLDVDDHKSIQGSTAGLVEKFGPDRCFGTPLSEDAMTGLAVGAAMAGYRPVHVHIRMDFMMLAMNQLVNIAAKAHYMYEGQVKVPLVVRTMIGRSWGQGAQHSQALHSMFMHVPGLKVVAPSNAHDAKGCMTAAIRDDSPVIFMEHRLFCNMQSYVPPEPFVTPLGQARVMHEGKDITIVGISHMVIESLRASHYLEKAGISAEIIDPISLRPLDMDTILASVKKTGRLLVVDNGWLTCGAASEIMTQVIEALPNGLNGKAIPMARMGFAEAPCPTTKPLENLFYPNGKTIAERAVRLIDPKAKLDLPADHDIQEVDEFKGPF